MEGTEPLQNNVTYSEVNEYSPLIASSTQIPPKLRRKLSMSARNFEKKDDNRVLGVFSGVFVPVSLSMFSGLLFLRMGYVLGNAGFLTTLLLFFISYIILCLTTISISAISTNGAIEGGGAYFMISRALGPEFGGALGILFYCAQVFACALYVSGCVEAVMGMAPVLPSNGHWWPYLYGLVISLLCFAVCLIGSKTFAKTSILFWIATLIVTGSVFVSFFAKHAKDVPFPPENKLIHRNTSSNTSGFGRYTGFSVATFKENLLPHYAFDYNIMHLTDFSVVFAVLFSSITGIMNGANMSGELEKPDKAIPRGTFAALIFNLIVYLILAFLTSFTCSRYLLQNNYAYLPPINLIPYIVNIGMLATTVSAALGNMIGASRILQALAKDHIFWNILYPATITTKSGNPWVSVLISFVLSEAVLLIGSLNAIAPITTIFFLLSYAGVNMACMALDLASAPNFRPTFHYFHWFLSGIAMLACIVMTFLIDSIYAIVGFSLLLVLILLLLYFRDLRTTWGSISQALIFHQVRKYLLLLDPRKDHIKYWRPHILLLVDNPRSSVPSIEFVNVLKKSGLFVIGHVKKRHEQVAQLSALAATQIEEDSLNRETPAWIEMVSLLRVKAFVELTYSETLYGGAEQLIRLSGLGGMKPNTVCFGFPDIGTYRDVLGERVQAHISHQSRLKIGRKDLLNAGDSSSLSILPPIIGTPTPNLEAKEFVDLLRLSLNLGKNLCILRHFNSKFNLTSLLHLHKVRIDAWPFDMLDKRLLFSLNDEMFSKILYDSCSLFVLQLACVLGMVRGWKNKVELRFILPVLPDQSKETVCARENQVRDLLKLLRISSSIHIVCLHELDTGSPSGAEHQSSEIPGNFPTTSHASSVNHIVRRESLNTNLCFLYLPRPPPASIGYEAQYSEILQIATQDLCPIVLVHGLNSVISTNL